MKISIKIDDRKIEAIRCYVPEDLNIEDEISKTVNSAAENAVNKLYSKHVPKSVQRFIERSAAMKSEPSKKKKAATETAESESEQI